MIFEAWDLLFYLKMRIAGIAIGALSFFALTSTSIAEWRCTTLCNSVGFASQLMTINETDQHSAWSSLQNRCSRFHGHGTIDSVTYCEPVPATETCDVVRQRLTTEVRAELELPRLNEVAESIRRAMTTGERDRLAAAAQTITSIDPFWDNFNSRPAHNAFREVGAAILERQGNEIAETDFVRSYDDSADYARFIRITPHYRETILFQSPSLGIGHRINNPSLLNRSRYEGMSNFVVRGLYNFATRSGQALISFTKNDAEGNARDVEMTLAGFIGSLMPQCPSESHPLATSPRSPGATRLAEASPQRNPTLRIPDALEPPPPSQLAPTAEAI